MQIWTITTDDHNGTQTAVHFTEAAADAAAMAFCREHWPKDAGPMPDDFTSAYDLIQSGDSGLIWIEVHDISGHPDLAMAKTALTQAETYIGAVLIWTQISLTRGQLIDLYDTVADAAAILSGRMANA